MLPVFVGSSVDMIREPVCWFFLILGLYFYVKAFENTTSYLMLFSSLSFLMASWARMEVFLFIVVSLLYLLLVKQKATNQETCLFCRPHSFYHDFGRVIYLSYPQ